MPIGIERAQAGVLHELARAYGRRIRHETTVGAGLPVIDTYYKLIESGDRVEKIEGLLSGTLGFLLDELSSGRSFSAALRDAMARGYTEPDPRDDLSGTDVARKLVILGREAGNALSLADVDVQSLVPEGLRAAAADEFMARLEELDAPMAQRHATAAQAGKVLRYVARLYARSKGSIWQPSSPAASATT